jgi:pimeloyl-ACP methyl ester carboxylesterase
LLTRTGNNHLITIDYRGFGDSFPETPGENGVAIDAKSVYSYVVGLGVPVHRIFLVGHSLGSGVAVELAKELSVGNPDEITFGGLVIVSGYATFGDAAIGYGTIPMLWPFSGNKYLESKIKDLLVDKWHSVSKISKISRPILILHGTNDRDINVWQGKALFLEACGLYKSGSKYEYWDLRNLIYSVDESVDVEADLDKTCWTFKNRKLMMVNHAGHNTLGEFSVVEHELESWQV